MIMKKILVPVDFSGNTDNTIKAACRFARRQQCGITLLHSYFDMALVQSINTVSPDDFMPVIDPDISFLKESCEVEMNQLVEKVRKENTDLTIESMVTGLELREITSEICSQNDTLMIIIGATGTGKKESFSGSAASSLFDCAPVPVLAIPENYVYDTSERRNILYATNFAEAAQDEVRFILNYFIGDDNSLYCRHLRFPDNDSLLDNAQMDVLSKPFAEEIKSGKVSFEIIDTKEADETLGQLVDQYKVGLISFHERNRGLFYHFFHKAIVKKDLYKLNIPLLVFRKFENTGNTTVV